MGDEKVEAAADSYSNELGRVAPDDVEGGNATVQDERLVPSRDIFERYINLSSVIYFSIICLCSWEGFALTFQFALLNGGPSALVYGTILVGFGGTAVAFSMAEMASIDPVLGAQYRWSASFAPFSPRFWGLIQGWLTVGAWTINCAGLPGVVANNIVGLAIFNNDGYTPHPWHITFIMWGLIFVPLVFNLGFRQLINTFELFGGIFHIIFFIASIVTLIVLARRSTVDYVFNTLTTGQSGWENPGVSWGIGLLTITYSVTGYDAVLHMSEEVKKVRTRTPQSIIIATVSNAVMLFGFVIALLFTIGNVDQVLTTPTGVPLIEVFYQATKSKAATTFLVLMPNIIFLFALFNYFASVSRLIWSFALDNGLPFSKFFSAVHPQLKLPLNALGLICVTSILLSIIYLISQTAFNAIVSLQTISLNVSYIPPILFILLRKIRGQHIPYGAFKLGRYGVPINLLAVLYLCFVVIWIPFPTILPVTANNMNYAGPLLGALIIGALLDWTISGHKRFQVPVLRNGDATGECG